MKHLAISQFGNRVLREYSKKLTIDQIKSSKNQALITSMKNLLIVKKLGIGLAAPQVGESVAVAVIELQKTELRPEIIELSLVLINPEIIETYGRKAQMWEGCISSGNGSANLFAKVPRYKKLLLEYYNELGVKHNQVFEGLAAHVIQHEVDHLNGTLFMDKVKDTTTYMTYKEYKRMTNTRRNQSSLKKRTD